MSGALQSRKQNETHWFSDFKLQKSLRIMLKCIRTFSEMVKFLPLEVDYEENNVKVEQKREKFGKNNSETSPANCREFRS